MLISSSSKQFLRGLRRLQTCTKVLGRWNHTRSDNISISKWNKPQNGLSYLSVPGQQALLGLTIGQLFDQTANKYGDNEALVAVHQGIRRTYSQIQSETNDLAEGFLELGFEKGDRLGIWGTNSHEWCLTKLAAAKSGLILVNINPAYEGPELLFALKKVKMRGIVIAEEFKNRKYYDIFASVLPSIETSDPGKFNNSAVPSLSTIISMAKKPLKGTFSFEEVLWKGSKDQDKKRLAGVTSSIDFDEVCNIQFTSGTTGKPKGVMLTHHNMINNSYLLSKTVKLTTRDRLCIAVPLFHCYGGVGAFLAGIHGGATCVFPTQGFQPKETIEVIQQEKCTFIYGTPTMHVDMISHSKGIDLSSLRVAMTAGAICPEDLAREMLQVYGSNIVSCYGLTETSPVFFQSFLDDTDEQVISTVGYPLQHTEVKVIDKKGQIVPLGTEGEMCTRGYLTMLGYWEDPEKTAEVLKPNGWFHTGDTFILEESGYGRIVGRTKDLIIRGGENIYPKEIEEFLHQHNKIAEAQVFGIPDDRLGEVVGVWIRLKDGETMTTEDIRHYSKGKIAAFKIPKHIFFRTDFPKTISGKIQKFQMREESIKILGLGVKQK